MNEAVVALEPRLWREVAHRYWSQRAGRWALGGLAALIALALLGPLVSPHAPDAPDWQAVGAAPGLAGAHWWGTDALGRDLFVRALTGLTLSLAIGLAATAASVLIGTLAGAATGQAGGRVDALVMRLLDVLMAVPALAFVLFLCVVLGREPWVMFVALAAVGWLETARVVRGQALALARREYVAAARLAGAGPLAVLGRHLLPNLAGLVVVQATLTVPQLILAESFLSFLGIGVQEPWASLGTLVADGARQMEVAPWLIVAPAGLLAALVLCLNVAGDALRDALDPRDD